MNQFVKRALEQISEAGYDYQSEVLRVALLEQEADYIGRIDLRVLQQQHKEWAETNFGDNRDPFMGMTEEAGELAEALLCQAALSMGLGRLSHALLKQKQGIRGTFEEHEEAAKDAVGDVFFYMLDLCNLKKWKAEQIIFDTWTKVLQKRNWKADPINGGS